MFEIFFNERATKQFRNLSKEISERISKVIDYKISKEPYTFGKPLRHSMTGIRTVRVGKYRILYQIKKDTVIVLAIEHRKDVYKNK